ncbi:aminoacyl-tRNA hydrolase [Aquibacillus rhizosphaerae]|uniref:peptidyl-tRNA hydrolase n=1 Tax=Aquibacillus rhizosphaerae TaxID=3051431 RepID=A0ABT7L679_9BACI|nr:aminoacyl-tRNA hydrolase [Aquibacillus sp. LR5S19]MDL4840712.1 aminoacyl-tRNA hydrolase [Aquibacillus sp. LR5S19]
MNEIVQYFVVNNDLEMSAGKVAAQVAHAATQAVFVYHKEADFKTWLETGQTKIILKAEQRKLEELKEIGFVSIQDAGKTEIEAGSLTVICLPPMNKVDAQKYTASFGLYK